MSENGRGLTKSGRGHKNFPAQYYNRAIDYKLYTYTEVAL